MDLSSKCVLKLEVLCFSWREIFFFIVSKENSYPVLLDFVAYSDCIHADVAWN